MLFALHLKDKCVLTVATRQFDVRAECDGMKLNCHCKHGCVCALSESKSNALVPLSCFGSCFSSDVEWIECTARSVFSPVVLLR